MVYGVLHDQVTARLCVEYFTIGHPRLFDTESPTLIALAWGVVATWWVGLLLGLPLAFAATRRSRPPRTARSLLCPIGVLLAATALTALVAGLAGHFAAAGNLVFLTEPLASRVLADRHVAFVAVLWAHTASYLAGFAGGIVLIARVWRSRSSTSP